jgi:hypothetical protein
VKKSARNRKRERERKSIMEDMLLAFEPKRRLVQEIPWKESCAAGVPGP